MDIGILGGGSAGCIAAIIAGRKGNKVTILEHTDKILKKLSATGNGKCNFTNMHISPEVYHTYDNSPIMKTLESFGVLDSIKLFKSLGIEPYDRNGYIYPLSEQAASVCDAIKNEIASLGVNIIYNVNINNIESKNQKVYLYTKDSKYIFDRLIIACGSKAYESFGSDGSAYILAKKLGYKINKVLPALCAMHIKDKKSIFIAKGVRVRADIGLYIDNEYKISEYGELQITDYGLSGIPIFQISRYASIALDENKTVSVKIDFFPHINNKVSFIKDRLNIPSIRQAKDIGIGIINDKLWSFILKKTGIRENLNKEKLNADDIEKLANNISKLKLEIEKMADFSKAQVCSGGIDISEVNPNTMQSIIHSNIYFAGEILDVDGICGGYNLQWAWSSGYLAGKYASRTGDINDKN